MPDLNRRQFVDPLESFLDSQNRIEDNAGRRAQYPSTQQLALPDLGGPPEQMRLFDTRRAGPANIYAMNPSLDASEWRDKDVVVPLGEEGQALVDDDEFTVSGEFFEFPTGRSDREFVAYGSAHREDLKRTQEEGTYLGHEEYPGRVNPGLQFSELLEDEGAAERSYGQSVSWYTPEGDTEVGRVEYDMGQWGPQVAYAEINPLYRGRGFSREAIPQFASRLGPGDGVVHAGGFTAAGDAAFHAKGIPTETDLDQGFYEFVGDLEPDEDDVVDFAMDRLRTMYGPTAVEADSSEWSEDMVDDYDHLLVTSAQLLQDDLQNDPTIQETYRENLELMQEQVLANLPTSRKGAFMSGWKPEHKTGRQEELPGMPLKYTGGG